MLTPCDTEGVCRQDCPRRNDDCDGNQSLMTKEEQEAEFLSLGPSPLIMTKEEIDAYYLSLEASGFWED